MSRRRVIAMLALLAAVAVIVAVLVSSRSPSKPNTEGPSTISGATTVQRRDLVQTDTESGTLSYANSYTVYNRLSGTITSLPAVGQVIRPGQTLYKVGNAPVILMDGTTPAYRDLNSSDSAGPDVLELNRNLVKLGFDAGGIVVNDAWQAATTEGVDLFQESLGEMQTGDITLGQVVLLPGNQLVSSVSATLGSGAVYHPPAAGSTPEFVSLSTPTGSSGSTPTGSGSSPSAPRAGGPSTPRSPSSSCKPSKSGKLGAPSASSKSKSSKKPCKLTPAQTIAALTALLNAETMELNADKNPTGSNKPSSKSPTGSTNPNSNGPTASSPQTTPTSPSSPSSANTGGGAAIMQTSSTQLVVRVDLNATKQSEAKLGEQVQVELPNGHTVKGKISVVSPVAQSSSGNGNGGGGGGNNNGSSSGSTIPVTVALSGHQAGAGLDQAAVSVNFANAQASNVLSVPVTALLATGGGNYAVQEAAAPRKLIPVTAALFAAGYVEISGPGIYPGLEVTDSQG